MRAALALLLALPALAGCASLEELDPMVMACREAAVQDAGWCGGVPVGDGKGEVPAGPKVERTAEGVAWSHALDGAHDRHTFAWDSPAKARLSWSGTGSGGMRVAVRDAAGNALYNSSPGASGGGEVLAGKAGSWSVALDFDNFAGAARVELRLA